MNNQFNLLNIDDEIATVQQDLDEMQSTLIKAMEAQEIVLGMMNKIAVKPSELISKAKLDELYIKNSNFIDHCQRVYAELLNTFMNMSTGNSNV